MSWMDKVRETAVGDLNCQKCARVWYDGPKMKVKIPDMGGNWRTVHWCLGCVVKVGNLQMMEVK